VGRATIYPVEPVPRALARPGASPFSQSIFEDTDVRTYTPKPVDIERVWYEVDADGAVLGRLATEVARVLRGKHKPVFAPHLDTGDHVVVVNAAKLVMTAGKADKKVHYRHSGYPGGLTSRRYSDLLAKEPEETFRRAVKGMMPKGPLGRHMLRKLKVYAGPSHPHAPQSPSPMPVDPRTYRAS
jgi:large subunit ribosomal protein L13